jgi:hypothetical protein
MQGVNAYGDAPEGFAEFVKLLLFGHSQENPNLYITIAVQIQSDLKSILVYP